MRIQYFAAIFIAALLTATAQLQAAELVDRIAAIVNDDAITVRELEERVRMAMALSQIKDSVDSRKRVVPQVLRKMIDEHLIMQESKKYKTSLSTKETDEYIHQIEKQNGMNPGTLTTELSKIGVSPASVREQFAADLTWQRLINGLYQSVVKVGDEEVTERLETLAERMGKPEYQVADILLLVDSPEQEEQVRTLGERLITQLREGAPFPVIATQFSQASSATNGGNIGWISEGGLDDDMFAVVKDLTPNTVSKLVRGTDGYHIFGLIGRRIAGTGIPGSDAVMTYSKMVLPIPTKDAPPKNVLISKADILVRGLKSCDEFEAKGRKESAVGIERVGPVKLTTLSEEMQSQLISVPQGETSLPIEDPRGIQVMMMCQRQDIPAPLPERENVRRQIENERIEALGRRLMRDMRRTAFIDTRL